MAAAVDNRAAEVHAQCSSDIVFATVGTSQDLVDAVLGPAGLMSEAAAPSILVDCSTISAEASAQIRQEAAARGTGLLAAPVMGNPRVARAGRLTLAVSGPRAAFDVAEPYLNLLGAGATYVGENEVARIVKLCHNLFLGTVAQSMAEITVLAEKSGVTRQAFLARGYRRPGAADRCRCGSRPQRRRAHLGRDEALAGRVRLAGTGQQVLEQVGAPASGPYDADFWIDR